jgi:FixJ family two-component response regulator
MGAFDYIMKPVQIEDLIEKMKKALEASKEDMT